jgi:hypothetical protein
VVVLARVVGHGNLADRCTPGHRCSSPVEHTGCPIVHKGCSCHSLGRPVDRNLDCTGICVSNGFQKIMPSRGV